MAVSIGRVGRRYEPSAASRPWRSAPAGSSLALAALVLAASPAALAQHTLDLSTHVLDLARGAGGAGVPVALDVRQGDAWRPVGRAVTAETGRVASFPLADPSAEAPGAGLYRLTFDMACFWTSDADGADFFPEITVVFRIADPRVHTHVPVVVSPFGYSTYRGN